MAQKKFSELEAGTVDGTSIFAQTKTEDGSLVSKSASSPSLAGYIGTSHQFTGLNTNAKTLVRAINEAASSGGASVIQKTQAEYDLLTTKQKMNGSIYKITDNAKMYCLDKAYHPVEECTVAEYNQKTSAQQNDGTIYIQTDAETTGEDIRVSSTGTRTIDEGIADANGQEIDYSTWSAMTPQEKADAGKVFVPDFPTATPNATEIPMSSSDNTSVADVLEIENITSSFFLSIQSGFSLTSGKVYKQGKRIFGNLVVGSNSDLPSTNIVIGTIKRDYRSAVEVNSFCGVSQTEWNTTAIGYLYMGATLAVATANSGMKFAKINFEYCTA